MKLFENPWFVGIGTGIISGILVFFLTKWIMDKRGKVEYFKQVDSANQNVINALKPYIADKGLPSIEIFEALISSTARAFCVNKKDMYSVTICCEELIREIISDVYVSNEKKQEYTDSLASYKVEIKKRKDAFEDSEKLCSSPRRYSERFSRQISTYIAAMTATMALTSCLAIFEVTEIDPNILWYPFESNPQMQIAIMLLIVVVPALAVVVLLDMLSKIMRRDRKKRDLWKTDDIDKSER